MLSHGIDVVVAAAATVLLVSGLVKVAVPGPITATLVSLWRQVTGRISPTGPSWLGRTLGVAEIGLAAWITLGRSTLAAAALCVFAAGLAAAGITGAMGADDVPCACFGGHQRTLGYLHVLQMPLWVMAAWFVSRPMGLVAHFDARLAMLGACATVASGFHVIRTWMALAPAARRRRQAANPQSRSLT